MRPAGKAGHGTPTRTTDPRDFGGRIQMLSNQPDALVQFERQALPCLDDLYRTARRVVRNRNQAEDLVQETFLQAWKCFHRFEPVTNCRAWLFKILFNVIHHHWRKQSFLKAVSESEQILEGMVVADAPVEEHITDEDILAALDRVPLPFREVLLLADVHEFSYKQISDILKIPLGTVMSRVSRGRHYLRQELLPYAQSVRIVPAIEPQLTCG